MKITSSRSTGRYNRQSSTTRKSLGPGHTRNQTGQPSRTGSSTESVASRKKFLIVVLVVALLAIVSTLISFAMNSSLGPPVSHTEMTPLKTVKSNHSVASKLTIAVKSKATAKSKRGNSGLGACPLINWIFVCFDSS